MPPTIDDRARPRDAPSDEALMAAWVGGDAAAFRELFARYAPRLHRAVRRQVRSEEDAREIVQQTFLHLHRARHDFQQGRPLRPWIFTICFNLRREHFRRRARRPETPLELAPGVEPREEAPDLLRAERAMQLRAAVAALPAGQREAFELHWFEELPYKEVAQIVGASESAVKVRAHRGYQRLRALLQDADAAEAARLEGEPPTPPVPAPGS
ncbi:MAG: RNA polymerase subunit sigma-70 [Sandaracinus sp.]|nr:RNA polymerase subunit sigma-70 [Myxococcales bacterium]MAT26537.1 RNA polymerase subunit sigma-70 [Sandaracinus sp.]